MHLSAPAAANCVAEIPARVATRGGRPKAAFVMDPTSRDLIYAPEEKAELARLTDVADRVIPFREWTRHADILAEAEVLFSGWSAPLMDETFLNAAPKLRAAARSASSNELEPIEWTR